MGINSSTRRVTVVNDNQNGVIRISESVVHKLSQTQQQRQQTNDNQSQEVEKQQSLPQQQQQQQSVQNSGRDSAVTPFSSGVYSSSLREEHERELRRLEKSWKTQIEELQKQNRQLWRSANDRLSANITESEKKTILTKREPICGQIEKQVVDCYQTNRSQPLKCSKEVKSFVNCVQEVRRNVLNRNSVSVSQTI